MVFAAMNTFLSPARTNQPSCRHWLVVFPLRFGVISYIIIDLIGVDRCVDFINDYSVLGAEHTLFLGPADIIGMWLTVRSILVNPSSLTSGFRVIQAICTISVELCVIRPCKFPEIRCIYHLYIPAFSSCECGDVCFIIVVAFIQLELELCFLQCRRRRN